MKETLSMKNGKIRVWSAPSKVGEITLFTITNAQGAKVTLSALGAGIVSVVVPDAAGKLADVVLGYKNPADYIADGPCAGKVPGRYANRIAGGRFPLDGKEYTVAINNVPNALTGGYTGFANRIWSAAVEGHNSVKFTCLSKDGEDGYPGNLTASATYVWTDDNVLELYLAATTDAPTVVDLTSHAYFNLAGEDSGRVLDHTLYLNAKKYLPPDNALNPTGRLVDVADTPMDFTSAKALGQDIKVDFPALNYGKGYDSCWVVDDWVKDTMNEVAVLAEKTSGRVLTVYSTQPGVQINTGNRLEGCPESISGHRYHNYDGVAIVCQGFPDAPNKPQFPSQTLMPGEEYKQLIFFEFTTINQS